MSKPKFTPFSDWVLVEQITPGMTSGGLHVPETTVHAQIRGRVLGVGPKVAQVLGAELTIGDVVYMNDDPDNAVNVSKGIGLVRAKDVAGRDDSGGVVDVVDVPEIAAGRTIQ